MAISMLPSYSALLDMLDFLRPKEPKGDLDLVESRFDLKA